MDRDGGIANRLFARVLSAPKLIWLCGRLLIFTNATSEGQIAAATVTITQAVDTNLVVTFAEPVLNALVGDALVVAATMASTYPLSSVFANILGQKVPLTLVPVGARGANYLWKANVDVSSLASGAWSVTGTATDTRGSIGVASVQFQRETRSGKGGSTTSTP